MPTDPTLLVPGDAEAVTRAVADLVVDAVGRALVERGEAVLALSGGRTPLPLYRQLAARDVDWRAVHVVQVDERVAPDDHPDRNWTAIQSSLVVPTGAVGHPMPVDVPAAEAARRYAAELQALGRIDVCHLGLGDDGHTASLVPGDAALAVTDRDVVPAGPYQGRLRLTLTAPAINRAGRIVWQVGGEGKRAAVGRLVAGTGTDPALLVRRGPEVWLVVDDAAGTGLAVPDG